MTVTLLKLHTMTYMSCILFFSCQQMDSKRILHDIHLPCVQRPSWSGWGEDTASFGRRPCALIPVFGWKTVGPPTAAVEYQPTVSSSKIWRYVKDLWKPFIKDSDPSWGLAFWLWLCWAWGSLERSSAVQWNWCAVLAALERLWMNWKRMKNDDSNCLVMFTICMTLKSKFNHDNSNDHQHHYHHKHPQTPSSSLSVASSSSSSSTSLRWANSAWCTSPCLLAPKSAKPLVVLHPQLNVKPS